MLQAKAADVSGETNEAYLEEIETLREKRALAAQELDELADASVESWDDAKDGFVEAYEACYEAFKEAMANFN